MRLRQARQAKKTRPESRVKQMKKDHPWSRAERIVPPEAGSIDVTNWNSTFQKSTEISCNKPHISAYPTPHMPQANVALAQHNPE